MANYILQLADGRKLQYPADDINFYPTIAENIENLKILGADPDTIIILGYPDPEYLYKVLTTNYLETNYKLDEFVRITNAVDFLGNDQILEKMMTFLLKMFNDPLIIEQYRPNKEKIKDVMFKLNNGPIHWLLQSTRKLNLDYHFQLMINNEEYDIAISDDLSYVAIWGWTSRTQNTGLKFINIYKNGNIIKSMTDLPNRAIPDKLIINNNGTIYSLFGSNVYIRNPPDYRLFLYKKTNSKDMTLSNDAKRYLSRPNDKSPYEVTELDTGKVLSIVAPYKQLISLPFRTSVAPKPVPSPHMDLLTVQNIEQFYPSPGTFRSSSRYTHLVWIVDNNTQSWINIPNSDIFKLSYSEKIIVTGKPKPKLIVGGYEVQLYKREGLNFTPLAHGYTIMGEPIAVSENLLLNKSIKVATKPGEVPMNDVINIYNIKGDIIESPPAYEINIPPTTRNYTSALFPGPNNTFMFMFAPTGDTIKLFKYSIKPYDTLNEFLVARLD